MEIASNILSSTLSKVGECLESSIHQASNLFHFNNIVEDFRKESENLKLLLDRVQQEVETGLRNTEDVEKWLRDVHDVLEQIQRLEDEIQAKKKILRGWCPYWGWRYELSRRALKKMSRVLELQDRGTALPSVEEPKDFISFTPSEHALSQIMEALKDDKINIVGLYGMGGVGKTKLAKVVAKIAVEEKLFDRVVMVTISQTPDIKDIQGQMALLLGLKLKEETVEGRAKRLFLRLKNEKKILIILDEVWAAHDLTTTGIPFGDDFKGHKILLTTRQQEVCIDMRCQLHIQLGILNEEEGMILFRNYMGQNNDSSNFNDVAEEVVRECKGLPIAIVTIGNALRGTTIKKWKAVSEKLKMSRFMDLETENVYACLKLSYDYLKEDELKFCFLLCSLFPEDFEISLEELLRFGLGVGLFQGAHLIEDARRELCKIIHILRASCLLLDFKEGFVKMHAWVRDVALKIASKGEVVFIVKAGMKLVKWPKQKDLERCTAISFMGSKIKVLPNQLVYPKLKILLLDGSFNDVSNEFFEEMKALKVASLRTFTLSLNSLHSLTNLVPLQLIDCKLKDMSSLKKLAKLENLILHNIFLVKLPEELRELSNLRMLDITACHRLNRIPVNVISSLSRLEEFYIGQNSFKAWEIEGTSAERSNARLSELSKLNYLTRLSLRISTIYQCLPKEFVLRTNLLSWYDIRVNYEDWWKPSIESRSLRITNIEVTSLSAFKALYKNLEDLELCKIKGCQNIVPSIDETSLIELKRLSLKLLLEVQCIVDMTEQHVPPNGFPGNLETLEVEYCDRMRFLFPSSLIQRLRKLKEVNIYLCHQLQVVFLLERYTKEIPVLLSSLASLHLRDLPNLGTIWMGPTQQISLESLTVVEVASCNKLRNVFTLPLARSLLQLQQLKVENCDSLEQLLELEVEDERKDIRLFPKLSSIYISGCGKLITLFPVTVTQLDFRQLTSLEVTRAAKLEEIFRHKNEADKKGDTELLLPQLRRLTLEGLENLSNFCPPGYHFVFPSLSRLWVKECPKITTRFSVEQNGTVHAQAEAQNSDNSVFILYFN